MKVIFAIVLVASSHGYLIPKLCRCSSSLHVSVESNRNNDSQDPCFTTTSTLFNESKLFLKSQQNENVIEQEIEAVPSVAANRYVIPTAPVASSNIREEKEFLMSSFSESTVNRIDEARETKVSLAMLGLVANTIDENNNEFIDLEEDINETARKINEVNFQLDEIAKDAATIQIFDIERVLSEDQKISSRIESVLTEALNGYENSDRVSKICERLSNCRLSIMKVTEIHIGVHQKMNEKSLIHKPDSNPVSKNIQEKVDDLISSICDELKVQIHIELIREKKVTDLITAVDRSIENKRHDIHDQEKCIDECGISSGTRLAQLKELKTCDNALIVALTDFNLYMKNIYEKTCIRRRKLESTLQKVQSVEWTDDVGIELVLAEITSLEDVLKKAMKEIQSESRAIYALKDRYQDDLLEKISILTKYGVVVNDQSLL